MQLSVKDLFGIIAFSAVVAWCASIAGVANPGFWIGVGITLFFSVVFVRVASDAKWHWGTFLVPVPLLGCCLSPVMTSIAALVNAVLLLGAGIFCAVRPPMAPRRLWIVALSCAAVSLVVGALPAISEIRELAALRQEFPVVPLESRLRYERSARRNVTGPPVDVREEVAGELGETEDLLGHLINRRSYRDHQLRQIHNRQYENFVRAMGFGVGRMLRPYPENLRRAPLRDIPFNTIPDAQEAGEWDVWKAIDSVGQSDDVEHLHKVSRSDFLDPDGFGAMFGPNVSVVGFVEHAFHHSPKEGLEDPDRWTIVRLELVSLLKFEEPRVYVLDHLPRMDQLAEDEIPTRPLDAFETDALEKLWTEKDLVVSANGRDFRMLGSLRAANQCLECHTAQRGELLGAFSYVLQLASTERG